jgi:hypothetical protein
VGLFEYHNELKRDALTVVITEATVIKSSRTFSSNAFGTRHNHSSGPNTEKEVNPHGREEEGCKEAGCQEEGREEEVTTSSEVFEIV